MKNRPQHQDLAQLVEQRRRELADRPDVSERTRKLSASSSRNQIGRRPIKRSNMRTLLIGAVAVFMVLACASSAVAVVAGSFWVRDQLSDPGTVVQQFYSALHQRSYTVAYGYLSNAQKSRMSEGVFADRYSEYDQINGVVETYPVTSKVIKGSSATIVAQVTRRADATTARVETITVVKQGNSWRIDNITVGATVPVSTATAGG